MAAIRLLTAADLHQSPLHYSALTHAVAEHRPDSVAIVGDALEAMGDTGKPKLTLLQCATILSKLRVKHLLFIRGNHEDTNWSEFVEVWPHKRRKLLGLYGSAHSIGPLVVVGFPCLTGSERAWCAHLSAGSNEMRLHHRHPREPLAPNTDAWLPKLLAETGPAGRTLWLMHESPVGYPLAAPYACNPAWTEAVERHAPQLVVAGHDHYTPLRNGTWHALLHRSVCVNVGQSEMQLHYGVFDFEFLDSTPSEALRIRLRTFPWKGEVMMIHSGLP